MRKDFIAVAYYTVNTIYEQEVKRLKSSLNKFSIPNHVEAIPDLGNWHKNVNYKPTFIRRMMDAYPNKSILYVDVDAEFFKYPRIFHYMKADIAVHEFDRKWYSPNHQGTEILSGTIFLQNNEASRQIVDQWEETCQKNMGDWDQRSLAKVLPQDFGKLPARYCVIFDTMATVEGKIIVHYQASRRARQNRKKIV